MDGILHWAKQQCLHDSGCEPGVRFARSAIGFFAFVPPELHLPFAMHAITTLDNLWMDRPRSIAAGLLESDGHRAIVDPGPGSTLESLRQGLQAHGLGDRKSTRLNSSHMSISYAVFCLKKKK